MHVSLYRSQIIYMVQLSDLPHTLTNKTISDKTIYIIVENIMESMINSVIKSVERKTKMKKVLLNADGENKGHYSPGIISRGTLYISGQLSIDLDTRKVADGGIDEHMKLALHNMERVLRAAELTRDHVVMCRIYVTDIDNWDRVNEIYSDYFGAHKPARIVVPVPALHFGCMVEIEAVAEVSE